MGTYKAFFGIFVEHLFFLDGLCRGLEFVPTKKCKSLMENTGLILKEDINGIRIFYDEQRKEALFLYANDPFDPLNFCFKVYSKDPLFLNYTDLPILTEDSILYFTDERATDMSSAGISLHKGEYISEKDFEHIDFEPIRNILSKQDRLVKPALIVNIYTKGAHSGLFDEQNNINPKKYFLKFFGRATFWKYYLLGDIKRKNLYIADVNHEIEFGESNETLLPDNRSSLVFKSKSPIPLREKSHFQFQLKERNRGNGKVLIRRLPVASPKMIFKEISKEGKKDELISEIYINY